MKLQFPTLLLATIMSRAVLAWPPVEQKLSTQIIQDLIQTGFKDIRQFCPENKFTIGDEEHKVDSHETFFDRYTKRCFYRDRKTGDTIVKAFEGNWASGLSVEMRVGHVPEKFFEKTNTKKFSRWSPDDEDELQFIVSKSIKDFRPVGYAGSGVGQMLAVYEQMSKMDRLRYDDGVNCLELLNQMRNAIIDACWTLATKYGLEIFWEDAHNYGVSLIDLFHFQISYDQNSQISVKALPVGIWAYKYPADNNRESTQIQDLAEREFWRLYPFVMKEFSGRRMKFVEPFSWARFPCGKTSTRM